MLLAKQSAMLTEAQVSLGCFIVTAAISCNCCQLTAHLQTKCFI